MMTYLEAVIFLLLFLLSELIYLQNIFDLCIELYLSLNIVTL